MQALEPSVFDVSADYSPVPAQLGSMMGEGSGSYSISSEGEVEFKVKSSDGQEHSIRTRLKTENGELETGEIKESSITFNSESFKVLYDTYEDYLKETIVLENEKAPHIFEFEVEVSEGIELTSEGGYIMVRNSQTGEELSMFRVPQGIDSNEMRIDYQYDISENPQSIGGDQRYQLSLIPTRNWQGPCPKYPIKIDPTLSTVEWSEDLVMVGQADTSDISDNQQGITRDQSSAKDGLPSEASAKDGDIITIDIDNLELSVDLSDEEIEQRLEDYDPEPAYTNGVLAKYVRDFGSAANGAVTNPGVQWD
jgi:hypothetical protein